MNIKMMKPKFIVFEGIDGCGKGTSVRFAKEMLDSKGIPCACVRDPGKTVIGEKIREKSTRGVRSGRTQLATCSNSSRYRR